MAHSDKTVRSQNSADLHWYGGDARIVATRGEIERVIAELTGLDHWLRSQLEPQGYFTDTSARLRLTLELPPLLERIAHIRNACAIASDSYFGGEVDISRELRSGNAPPIPELAAGLLSAGAVIGAFAETPVSANIVQVTEESPPPRSIYDLADRLASTAKISDGWLRIEKFEPASPVKGDQGGAETSGNSAVSKAKFVVYIPGTQSWAPQAADNPLDVTSNLGAISKTGFAGSERAVALAMTQAGVNSDDQVLFVGHSQGGMVAANLALSFPRSKLLTFGSPLGQLSTRLKAPILAVEHTRDGVPRVDGKPNPVTANWVTVRQDIPGIDPIGQHEMKGYLETAAKIDAEPEPPPGKKQTPNSGLQKTRDMLAGFAGKAAGRVIFFELKRQPNAN